MNITITSLIRSALPLAVLLLTACGGGGGGGATKSPATTTTATDAHSVVYAVNKSAPIATCASGGITVQSGIDSNGNGALDTAEITSTQYVCNGASGSAALVAMTAETAGANCTSGGEKVSAGLDANGNGTLDSGEITTTAYVCNGANGTNGTNGLNTLVAIVDEAAGANCTYGGIKVTSGLDTNANTTLDSGEVTTTKYVCNGPGINWVDVTSTTVTAARNTGYSADNAALVTITLPASTALTKDDIIQVDGIGAGGWAIAQALGQSIIIDNITSIAGANAAVISGSQHAAIELQYIGGGVFTVLNYTGPVGVLLPGGYVYEGGLTWMPVAANGGLGYTQPNAATLCAGTAGMINGVTDWRLPTTSELSALYSTYPNNSSVLTGQGWTLNYTWSSTAFSAGFHYAVGLGYGYVSSSNDTITNYVTCVR
jgi:hypothetical protein